MVRMEIVRISVMPAFRVVGVVDERTCFAQLDRLLAMGMSLKESKRVSNTPSTLLSTLWAVL